MEVNLNNIYQGAYGKWYFSSIDFRSYGPYDTFEDAKKDYLEYVKQQN